MTKTAYHCYAWQAASLWDALARMRRDHGRFDMGELAPVSVSACDDWVYHHASGARVVGVSS